MHELIGKKITAVRRMTDAELTREGWEDNRRHGSPVAIVFNNGIILYASQDDDGNGPGALFGLTPEGTTFGLTVSG